jgi:hypothetical protein
MTKTADDEGKEMYNAIEKTPKKGPNENKTCTCRRNHSHLLGNTLLRLLFQHRSMAATERLQKSFGFRWKIAIQATAISSLQEIQQLAPVFGLKLRS